MDKNQALSVEVTSTIATRENPILVVVRQQKGVLSWQLPLLLDTASGLYIQFYNIVFNFYMFMSGFFRQEYGSVSRTLCTEPLQHNITVEHEFFLGIR